MSHNCLHNSCFPATIFLKDVVEAGVFSLDILQKMLVSQLKNADSTDKRRPRVITSQIVSHLQELPHLMRLGILVS